MLQQHSNNKRRALWSHAAAATPVRPKRTIITKDRCTHRTAQGTQCAHSASQTIDGKRVCGIHYAYINNAECAICLEPQDAPWERTKLGCGHKFHTNCLSHCQSPTCPTCRAPWTPAEATKLLLPTKLQPLLDDVFALDPSKQSLVFAIINKTVAYAKQATTYDLDALNMYLAPFTNCSLQLAPPHLDAIVTNSTTVINYAVRSSPDAMLALNNTVDSAIMCFDKVFGGASTGKLAGNPFDVLYDIMEVTEAMAAHVSTYNTYEGLVYAITNQSISVQSTNPYIITAAGGEGGSVAARAAAAGVPVVAAPPPGAGGEGLVSGVGGGLGVGAAGGGVMPVAPAGSVPAAGGVPLQSPASPVVRARSAAPSPESPGYSPTSPAYMSHSPIVPWYAL